MFRVVAKGKYVSKWEDSDEWSVALMNELKNTLNTMYGTDWEIEYKDKA